MNPEPEVPAELITYRIDGAAIQDWDDFWVEIGRAVNGPGGYFGKNLDALADCLRGGFGTPTDRPFRFVWTDSTTARARLVGQPSRGRASIDRLAEVFAAEGVPLAFD